MSCVTLQGTCFDKHTSLAFNSIPGYALISDAYCIISHCGVAIYLNNDFCIKENSSIIPFSKYGY